VYVQSSLKIYACSISTNRAKNSETGFLEGQGLSVPSLGNTCRKNVEGMVDHGVLFAFVKRAGVPSGLSGQCENHKYLEE